MNQAEEPRTFKSLVIWTPHCGRKALVRPGARIRSPSHALTPRQMLHRPSCKSECPTINLTSKDSGVPISDGLDPIRASTPRVSRVCSGTWVVLERLREADADSL